MKRLFIASFLVLISISGFGQEKNLTQKRKTRFGITGGFKQDFFTTSPYTFNGLNMYGGFFVERKLSKKFDLQLEALHTFTQGSGYNTIEIPLFLKYRISERFRVYVGPQVNWSYKRAYDDPVYDQRPGNFAVALGIEYDVSDKWYLFARYVHNLKRVQEQGSPAFMRTIMVGVGYRF